jgi:hypothetical protein
VSPKSWRWAGRSRPAEDLIELSAERATGALYLNGRWGGTIFLTRGRIGYVQSVRTPGIEALLLRTTYDDERRWADVVTTLRRGESDAAVAAAAQVLHRPSTTAEAGEILRRSAMADAALATLGTAVPETARSRSRFRPGEKHWYESARTFTVTEVLAEVTRRQAVLAGLTLGVRPERVVRRAPRLPVERIRLTATQWNIARSADGGNTPLDIAWLLGQGGFATTMAVHRLALLGIVTADSDPTEIPSPATIPARYPMTFIRASNQRSFV